VVDLGEGPGDKSLPLFWVKKKSQKEEKPAGQTKKRPPPPCLSSRSRSATANSLQVNAMTEKSYYY